MRKFGLIFAASLLATSTAAMAGDPVDTTGQSKAVRLTDAELDDITAGDAFTATILSNPGNADSLFFSRSGNHANCINECIVPTGNRASGFIFIQNPAQTRIISINGG